MLILDTKQALPLLVCLSRLHDIPSAVTTQYLQIKAAQNLVVYILDSESRNLSVNLSPVSFLFAKKGFGILILWVVCRFADCQAQ